MPREGAGGQRGCLIIDPPPGLVSAIVRLARPTLDWCAVWGASYAMGLGDILNHPMDNGAGLTFAFVGSLRRAHVRKTKG